MKEQWSVNEVVGVRRSAKLRSSEVREEQPCWWAMGPSPKSGFFDELDGCFLVVHECNEAGDVD